MMYFAPLSQLLLSSFLAFSVCQSPVKKDDGGNTLDDIFSVNQITGNGQLAFGWDGPELFEGDIVKTKRLEQDIADLKAAAKKGGSPFDAIARGQWPGGIIPYTFNYRFRGQSHVMGAIADYTRHTCIKWVRRTNQRDYVEFFHGSGCYSMIGRQGGRQQISLASGCLSKGIVIHEMMHAAGFFHEQSRLDRDNYITIVWRNISPRMRYNFEKYKPGKASTLGEPYDKRSVMHYGNYAFSINRQKTIISRSNPSERLGQRSGFSRIDINQLNKYYQCRKGGTVRPPVRPPPPGGCTDGYPFCGALRGKWCSHSWVKTNCKKSCGCDCKDLNQFCGSWAKAGYCSSKFVAYMAKNCKKSCRKC